MNKKQPEIVYPYTILGEARKDLRDLYDDLYNTSKGAQEKTENMILSIDVASAFGCRGESENAFMKKVQQVMKEIEIESYAIGSSIHDLHRKYEELSTSASTKYDIVSEDVEDEDEDA